MKRKRKDDAGSLDSLLDTITTVVGILIILLIVVQLGADSAVNRIVDERKKENADELMELAMKQFEDQKKTLLEEKKKIQLKLASENKEQAQLIQEISKLEKELAAKKKAMPPTPPKVQNLGQFSGHSHGRPLRKARRPVHYAQGQEWKGDQGTDHSVVQGLSANCP